MEEEGPDTTFSYEIDKKNTIKRSLIPTPRYFFYF